MRAEDAPQVAERLGVVVKESKSSGSSNSDYVNLVTLRSGTHSIAATLVGLVFAAVRLA